MGSTDEPLIRQQQQQQQQLLVMEIIVQDSETINHNDHTHHISKIHSKKWVFCGGNGPVGVFPVQSNVSQSSPQIWRKMVD